MKTIRYGLLLLLFFVGAQASAQNDSIAKKIIFSKKMNIEAALEKAENSYFDGKIKEADSLLSIMAGSSRLRTATKDQKESIYRLLANCNLLLNEPQKAHSNIKKLLAVKPFYSSTADTKEDLILFSQEIENLERFALPLFQAGIMVGLNFPNFNNPITEAAIYDIKDASTMGKYTAQSGIHISLTSEYALTRHFSLSVEPGFLKHQFTFANGGIAESYVSELSFSQQTEYLYLPMLVKVSLIPTSPIKLYVQAGGYYKQMRTAKRNINRQGDISILDITNKSNSGMVVGFGLKLPNKHNSFFVDFKFLKSSDLLNDKQMRYNFNDETVNSMIFKYHHIENDITQNSIHFCVGYQRHLAYKVFKK